LEALDISVNNFTTILSSKCTQIQYVKCLILIFANFTDVDQRIGQSLQDLQYSRAREARDFALLEDNNAYVSFWSIVQCAVIIATTSFQVYFVRKLFDAGDKPSVRGGKARA
jgi:hypothetical protein